MIHSVALIIADFLFSKDAITEEEKEVCAYGMELIISGIISVALVLIIGLITGNIWYAVIYNMMMILIRTYTGGYHADTHAGCNVCYCGVYLISLLMLRIQVYIRETIIITWLIALAGYLIIVLNAPLEHHNKKLTMEQKEKYMIVSAVLGIASMLISFILNIIGVVIRYGKYSFLCRISLYINTMLLIIGLLLLLGYERRVDFMKRILKGMAEAAKKTAKASVNSASFLSMYQPKEPDVLKKKETK